MSASRNVALSTSPRSRNVSSLATWGEESLTNVSRHASASHVDVQLYATEESLLMRVSDAVWVAVLVLLTLQASFLMPPVGYALMMTRSALGAATPLGPVIRALAPFLAVQAAVLALLIAFPQLVHIGEKADSRSRGGPNTPMAPGELERRMREMLPAPVPPGAPGGLPPFAPVPPLPPAR